MKLKSKVSIIFKNDRLFYLDQTKLPEKESWSESKNLNDCYWAIKKLKIRGAPLIGVFAAYSLYLSAKNFKGTSKLFLTYFNKTIKHLKQSRPTAVNLFWALEKIENKVLANKNKTIDQLKKIILNQAKNIHAQDILLCKNLGKHGLNLVRRGDRILTHCNAGWLATSGSGTALAVIYQAKRKYGKIKVYADETRPLLQGARLTAWELTKKKIDVTLISDNMAGYLMQQGLIDKVFLGADRIARNGDVANKIGTYGVAILANFHKIPFYVVAPVTTFDLKLTSGKNIPIEQRDPEEVRTILGKVRIAPAKVKVYNPAFDLTPNKLITAIVTDRGIIYPPFKKSIKKLIGS